MKTHYAELAYRAYSELDCYQRAARRYEIEPMQKHWNAAVSAFHALADAMGYGVTIGTMPMAPRTPVAAPARAADAVDALFEKVNAMALAPKGRHIPASEVKVGDLIDGHFRVGDISHGPLPNQVRFRNPDDTAVMFVGDDDMMLVEREPKQ